MGELGRVAPQARLNHGRGRLSRSASDHRGLSRAGPPGGDGIGVPAETTLRRRRPEPPSYEDVVGLAVPNHQAAGLTRYRIIKGALE